jgi:hypothetical protein
LLKAPANEPKVKIDSKGFSLVAGILFVESFPVLLLFGFWFVGVSIPLPGFYLLKEGDRPNPIRERILPTVFVHFIFTFLTAPLIATSSQLRGHPKYLNYKIVKVLAFLSTSASFAFTSVHKNHKPIALPLSRVLPAKKPDFPSNRVDCL